MNGGSRKPRIPLHERLYRDLRQRIDSEDWPAGHQLPTENSLAAEFQVSRGTIRQAVTRLVSDGLVERTAGRGTFVSSRRLVYPVVDLIGFTEQITASGHIPSSRVVDVTEVDAAQVCGDFDFGPSVRRLLSIERVRNADGEPVALEHLLLPLPRFAGVRDVDLGQASVYETLEEHFGVRIRLGDFTLDIDDLTDRQAELLGDPPRSPVFLMSGSVLDQSRRTVVGVRCYYRRDRYSFTFSMARRPASHVNQPRLVLSHTGSGSRPA
ncbi:MAG: GntR family transcriptional regulator [Stackebrandtia sp.]